MYTQQLQAQIKQTQFLISKGAYSNALQLLGGLQKSNPKNVDILALSGFCHKQLGENKRAAQLFKKCLKVNNKMANVYYWFSEVLIADNKYGQAENMIRRALSLAPDNIDYILKLALIYHKSERHNLLEAYLSKILFKQPNDLKTLHFLGWHYQEVEDNEKALKLYERLLSIDPENVAALHNKGVILKVEQKFSESIKLLQQALELEPKKPSILHNIGSCFASLGKIDEAKQYFEKAIVLEPLNPSHHHWLNQILYTEKNHAFLESYKRVLAKTPNPSLTRELAFKLLLADRLEEASEEINKSIHGDPKNPLGYKILGQINRKQRAFDEAVDNHNKALSLDSSEYLKEELATSLLAAGEGKKAQAIIDGLLKSNHKHQGYWALKSTALRILESEQYYELCNYDELVLETSIETPADYESLGSFNEALEKYLTSLHVAKDSPLEQTLKNGTQTLGDLFKYDNELVRQLRSQIDQEMECFLTKLTPSCSHPTLSRLTNNYGYTGSWSVLLRRGGHHINHFHSHGWYSGPYYVKVPSIVDSCANKSGWIKLGEPGFECIVDLAADKYIKPVPGKLIRFPSFMWHGTVAFDSNDTRMIVASDLIPEKEL